MTFNLPPVMKPKADAFARNMVSGVEPDKLATAARDMRAFLDKWSIYMKDSHVLLVADQGFADHYTQMLSDLFTATGAMVSAINANADNMGLRIGGEFDSDPMQHDIYVKYVGDEE